MHKQSVNASLSVSRNLRDSEQANRNIPSQATARKIAFDPPVKVLSMKSNPLETSQTQRHKRAKSQLDSSGRQTISQQLDRKPLLSQHSPYKRADNLKMIDSYEMRISQLTHENNLLQNELFAEQQRHNQQLIEYELHAKNNESRYLQEQKNVQQQKLLLNSKQEEIGIQNQEIERLITRVHDLENACANYQNELSHMNSLNESRKLEIDQLRQLLLEKESQQRLDLDQVNYKWEQHYKIIFESQSKDQKHIQQQQLMRLEDHLRESQNKYLRIQGEKDVLSGECQQLQLQHKDLIMERDRFYEDQNKHVKLIEEQKLTIEDQGRAIDILQSRVQMLDKSYQQSLEEMRAHYEFMRKSQTDKELKELSMRFASERAALENSIRTLSGKVYDLDQRLNDKNDENKQISIKLQEQEILYRNTLQEFENFKEQRLIAFEDQELELRKLKSNLKYKDEFIQSTQNTLNSKEEQLEQLRQKYQQLENQSQMELHELQQQLEDQRRENKEAVQSLNHEKSVLEQQIKSAKTRITETETLSQQLYEKLDHLQKEYADALQEKNSIVQKLQQEKQQLEFTSKQQSIKISQQDQQVSDLREQVTLLNGQLEDLAQQNESDRGIALQNQLKLEDKLQQLRLQQQSFDDGVQQYVQQIETLTHRNQQLESIQQQQIEEFKRREQKYNGEIHALKSEVEYKTQEKVEIESMHTSTVDQIDQLKRAVRKQEAAVEEWKVRYAELENEYNNVVEEHTQKIEYYQQLELDQGDQQTKYKAERSAYETRIAQLEKHIDDDESRKRQLQRDNRSLEEVIEQKVKEIENLKQQLNKDFISVDEYNQLVKKNQALRDEIDSLEQNQITVNIEKQQLGKAIQKLEDDILIKNQEVKQTQDLMNKRRVDQDAQAIALEKAQKEVQRLNHDLQDAQTTQDTKQEQLKAARRENEDLAVQVSQLKRQLASSEDQLKKQSSEILQKIQEMDQMKVKYEQVWSKPQQLTTSKITVTRNSQVISSPRDRSGTNPLNEPQVFTQTKSRKNSQDQ